MSEGRADRGALDQGVPADLPIGFAIAAITAREDPRTLLFLLRIKTQEMPKSAPSHLHLRRSSQITERFPHLQIRLLRGNVDTRSRSSTAASTNAIVLRRRR